MHEFQTQQKNRFARSLKQRGIALALALSMLVQYAVLPSGLRVNAVKSAATNGIVEMDAANVNHSETLVDNGDGTFTLTMTFSTSSGYDDENQSQAIARNGYFTAPHEGDYLVEVWGGDGAGGEKTDYSYNGEASKGGAGGYVYGVVHLNKGDTIYYTLGGDGSLTDSTESGGGVNGDGGHHGDSGSSKVGGGGGYSAVFLFKAGSNFESDYLDADGKLIQESILEADRLTKYILIAGGGGGGGAGNGWHLIDKATGTPDGGAGGTMSSTKGDVVENGSTIGYFFAGSDGLSSGANVDYVGHGGTNKPGIINDTFTDLGWFEGKEPNDWAGTNNPDFLGGAGGAGNLRGGGGGGGYAGGSGGAQSSLLAPINIGGGGGGSSYIEREIYDKTDYEKIADQLHTNDSTTGGAVVITCVSDPNAESSQKIASAMKQFAVGGTVSKYFSIDASKSTIVSNTETNVTPKLTVNADNTFSATGDVHGTKGEGSFTVTLVLKPADGFLGGNNVPLFDGLYYSMPNLTSGTQTVDANLPDSVTHVNVGLTMGLKTYSHITDDPNESFKADRLFDNESSVWPADGSDDFIQSVQGYTVNGASIDYATYSVVPGSLGKHIYTVGYTVTMKNTGVAVVGDPIDTVTTITADAVITVVEDGTVDTTLGDINLSYYKKLVYNNDGTYTLSLNVRGQGPEVGYTETSSYLPKPNPSSTVINFNDTAASTYLAAASFGYSGTFSDTSNYKQYTFTTPVAGYYLFQVWAAEGGDSSNGNAGALGGYVYGYCYLAQNATASIVVGNIGAAGVSSGWQSKDGSSGKPSFVYINDTVQLIARGGDAGKAYGSNHPPAVDGSGTTDDDDIKNYVGHPEPGWFQEADTFNYLASTMQQDTTNLSVSDALKQTIDSALTAAAPANATRSNSTNVGEIQITCLATTGTQTTSTENTAKADAAEVFNDPFSLTTLISQYFDVTDTSGVNNKADNTTSSLSFTPDTDLTDRNITFSNIAPEVTTAKVDEKNAYQSTIDFTVNIIFKPRDLFLGGNDVPVLVYTSADSTGMTLSQGANSIQIVQQNITDFANVEITPPVAADLTVSDRYYIIGEPAFALDSLYSWDNSLAAQEAWTYAFVDFEAAVDPANGQPSQDTSYKVTVSVAPKTNATKAVVIPSVSAKSVTKYANVTVYNQAIYNLTNLTTSHIPTTVDGYSGTYYTFLPDQDYKATLSPADGYNLPASITVKVGSTILQASEYGYNPTTGELHIPASKINNQVVTIEATAQVKTFTVTFVSTDVPSLNKIFTYPAGTALGEDLLAHYASPAAPDKTGYKFQWEWEGGKPTDNRMPAKNQLVIGTYVAQPYNVTVEYYYSGQATPFKTVTIENVLYGDTYRHIPENIPGYLADRSEVTGTMDAEGKIEKVTYSPTAGKLNIVYIFTDGYKDSFTVTLENYKTGDSFTEALQSEPGYSLYPAESGGEAITQVTGTMDADGVTVYVYYRPNRYTVSFNSDGGTAFDPFTVLYNKAYGYNPDTGTYRALPTPVRTGYTFGGWLDENGNLVKAEQLYLLADNQTLTAKWNADQYTITVHYQYTDGSTAFSSVTQEIAYGSDYSIASPTAPEGYQLKDSTQATISGKMGSQNTAIVVLYEASEYLLTIQYLDAANGNQLMASTTHAVRYNDTFTAVPPAVDGYKCDTDLIEVVMPAGDHTVTVYYRQEEAEMTVSVTVDWGNLSFSYDYGAWDPETHTYPDPEITPLGNNTITVTSGDETNVELIVDFSYSGYDVYDMDVLFSKDQTIWRENLTETLVAKTDANSVVVYVKPTGQLPVGMNNQTVTIGQCTVTISAGADIQ